MSEAKSMTDPKARNVMFDLRKEVATWSQSVKVGSCGTTQTLDKAELIDHLYCEIERGRSTGLTDEQAFAAAVAKIGRLPELTVEGAKNRSRLGAAWAGIVRFECAQYSAVEPQHRKVLVANAILWSALVVASTLVLSASDAAETLGVLITTVWVPMWLSSDLLLRRALRSKPTGRT
jgi:hypothetical protein